MIFKQLITGRQFSSFILIKDNPNHSARHVLRKIIRENIERGNSVHLFNYECADSSLYYDFMSTSSFFIHNCFHDPWDLHTDECKHNIPQSWVSPLSTEEGVFNVVVLNSISHALQDLSLDSVCLQLNALKALNDVSHRTEVIGIVNSSLTPDGSVEFRELNRLAESLLTLSSPPDSPHVCVEHRKPFGKLMEGVYRVSLDENECFEFSEMPLASKGSEDIVSTESAPQVLTTFKLTLEDKEKESRRQVVLPYLKNAGGGGGKITYEPDANDDWDDEDPDDDLEI